MSKTKKQPASKSSRLGKIHEKGYIKSPPLRFLSIKDAKAHMRANQLKLMEHVSHTRGDRFNVKYPDGSLRTIVIVKAQDADTN